MNRHRSRASIELLAIPASQVSADMLQCSEHSLMATDQLRSALLDLKAAYLLLEQLVELSKSHAPSPTKDI
jgi:hypothetical protein